MHRAIPIAGGTYQLQAVLIFVWQGQHLQLYALGCIDKGCTLKENPHKSIIKVEKVYGNRGVEKGDETKIPPAHGDVLQVVTIASEDTSRQECLCNTKNRKR